MGVYRENCPNCNSRNYTENYAVEDCKDCGYHIGYHSGRRSKVAADHLNRHYQEVERRDKEASRQIYRDIWGEEPPDDY